MADTVTITVDTDEKKKPRRTATRSGGGATTSTPTRPKANTSTPRNPRTPRTTPSFESLKRQLDDYDRSVKDGKADPERLVTILRQIVLALVLEASSVKKGVETIEKEKPELNGRLNKAEKDAEEAIKLAKSINDRINGAVEQDEAAGDNSLLKMLAEGEFTKLREEGGLVITTTYRHIAKMRSAITELQTQMGIVISRLDGHDDDIDELQKATVNKAALLVAMLVSIVVGIITGIVKFLASVPSSTKQVTINNVVVTVTQPNQQWAGFWPAFGFGVVAFFASMVILGIIAMFIPNGKRTEATPRTRTVRSQRTDGDDDYLMAGLDRRIADARKRHADKRDAKEAAKQSRRTTTVQKTTTTSTTPDAPEPTVPADETPETTEEQKQTLRDLGFTDDDSEQIVASTAHNQP